MSTKLGTLTLDLVARIGSFTQGMRDASASAEREMGRAGNSVNTMDGLLKKLAVTAGAVFSVSQIANYADSYSGMVNKLKLVTQTQGELSEAMNSTYKIAQATASDWESVITVYTKFQKISEKLGLSQEDVSRITETVTKAVSMSGATADEAQRALMQFGQALNTGALKGQDLNSILSQTPGLTDAIAEGMGVASGSLKELGAAGKLTNEMVISSLQKVASSVDDKYAETATLISSSFDLVKNSAKKMIGEFDAANGVSAKFVAGMTGIAENLESITKVMMVAGAYMAGTYIPMIIKGTYATVSDTVSKVANIVALRAKAVADYDVAKSNLAATAAMARAMGATNAQTAAMMTNARAAYQQAAAAKAAALSGAGLSSALLGPVGVGIALASVAAGYLLMKGNAEKATASIEYQGQKVDDLIVKYRELNTLQRDNETKALADQVEELGLKYRVATSDLHAFMEGLPIADEKIATFRKLNSELSQGKISTVEYYQAVKKVNILSDSQLNKVRGLIGGYADSKKAFNEAETAQKALNTASESASQAHKEQKNSVDKLAKSYADLSKEQQKALDKIKESTNSNIYVQEFVKAGGSKEKAEFFLDYKKSASMQPKDRLSKYEISQLNTGFNAQNYSFKAADLKAIAKVNGIASANNFAQIEGLYGLPKGSLAALVLQESSGNASAVSETGALGLFQTTGIFRKEYGLNSKSSIEAQASAAAKDLAKNLKEFGSLEKALMAYNAGAGGTRQYLAGNIGNGKNQMSTAKAKEVASYASGWSKWYAGVNGKSSIDQNVLTPSDSDKLAQVNAAADSQKLLSDAKLEIDSKYYTQTESLAEENRKAIEKINLTLGGEPKALKASLAKQAELFKNQTTELELNKKAEYQSYFEFETDRITQITQSYNIEKGLVQTNAEYSKAKKQELSDALERQKQQEIDAVKREEAQMIQAATQAYQTETAVVIARYKVERDEILKNYTLTKETRQKLIEANSMGIFYERNRASSDLFDKTAQSREYLFQRNNPVGYDEWSMQNQYSSASSSLFDSFSKDLAGANGIEDEEERNAQLLETHERYLEAKAALDDEYAQRERDLEQQNFETRLAVYSQIAGMVSQTFDQMTDMLRESVGESNALYKTMFLAGKAASIAQAIVNTEEGATKALAQGGAYGGILAGVIRATGYASVGIMAAQTITGMAHDGIDNIPKEGTWLLDKGERVVDSRTNSDLKNYLAKGGGGGNVTINQSINIASDGTATTQNDSKQLGALINNAVLAVIRKEQRQGGLLSK